MPSPADNAILTFPPRSISQWERDLLNEWFAATQRKKLDVTSASVRERRGDDPKFYGKIGVALRAGLEPAYLIYSPAGSTIWVVTTGSMWNQVQRFPTLRLALNSIRRVLDESTESQSGVSMESLVF
jgi:hypothetical protein